MNDEKLSRRQALQRTGVMAAGMGGVLMNEEALASSLQQRNEEAKGTWNVKDFGAKGDGAADDSAAFQAALNTAGEAGGGIVSVPRGNFLIRGNLNVPEHVTIEGVFRAPTARTQNRGSTLLAVADAGKVDGTPFITLHQNSTLHGITVFYPEQKQQDPPVPYPWTVRGIGDNCSLVDVLLVNPYQAVDFGTHAAGRHYIKGLYAQALYRGLFIDQCYDVGRVENIHFWPFWEVYQTKLKDFTEREGIAFVIGRTDWEYLTNCFCIGYRVGFHFIGTKAGAPNCVLTQCGSDVGPTAVRVEHCQHHAGLSFVNGQMMAGIEIKESNTGPVKFTACGFWGVKSTDSHAVLEGKGHTTFTNCHFISWAQRTPGAPCIDARRGGLTVNGCDFMDEGKAQIAIGERVDAALVFGNRLRGKENIANKAGERAQMSLNVVSQTVKR